MLLVVDLVPFKSYLRLGRTLEHLKACRYAYIRRLMIVTVTLVIDVEEFHSSQKVTIYILTHSTDNLNERVAMMVTMILEIYYITIRDRSVRIPQRDKLYSR